MVGDVVLINTVEAYLKKEDKHLKQQLDESLLEEIRLYWNDHIHDLEIATHKVGSVEFFRELEEYRFDKLRYLPKLIDFSAFRGKRVLEVGCGVGIDLVRFARGGAIVTGIDLSETAIELARKNFASDHLRVDLQVMNGEDMHFEDECFDVVYAHGVLQYTANPALMIKEIHRVLRPYGEAVMMVYNKYSWLNFASKIMKVRLEHEDAPAYRKISVLEFSNYLRPFPSIRIVTERFPVKTRLHHGIKARLYNHVFVKLFTLLPKPIVRPLGWHLIAFATK